MGGKCRHCHKKISIEYPLFEIASLALTLGVYLRFGISIFSVALFLSLSCLLVASALDIESMEVELGIFIAGIVFALIWYFGSNGLSLSSAALLGWAILLAVFLPLVFYLVSHEKWMGLGDAIFALWAAILVGFPLSGVAMFCAFVSGAIFGIIMIVMRKRDAKVGIPFGPFIALGAIIALFWGNIILDAYLKIIGF